MIHRTCPVCGAELYSAASGQPWICPICGCGVPNEPQSLCRTCGRKYCLYAGPVPECDEWVPKCPEVTD